MLRVKVEDLKEFTEKQRVRLVQIGKKVEFIFNSPEFEKMFMDANFSGELSEFKDLDRKKLFDHFMTGAEKLDKVNDQTANMFIRGYYSFRSVYGYTYGHVKQFWINVKFIGRSNRSIGGTMAHEWTHKMGAHHDFSPTARRKNSISYKTGNIVTELWVKFFEIEAVNRIYKPSKWQRVKSFFRNLF